MLCSNKSSLDSGCYPLVSVSHYGPWSSARDLLPRFRGRTVPEVFTGQLITSTQFSLTRTDDMASPRGKGKSSWEMWLFVGWVTPSGQQLWRIEWAQGSLGEGCLPLPPANVSVGDNGLNGFSYMQLAEAWICDRRSEDLVAGNLKFKTRLSCDLAIPLLGTNPRGRKRRTRECLLQLCCSHEPKLNFCQ